MSIGGKVKLKYFSRKLLFKGKPGVAAAFWKSFNHSPLKQAGVYVMKTARNSIRRKSPGDHRASPPGKPPFAHANKGKLPAFRMIFSVPSRLDTTVTVGMVGFHKGTPPVPGIHEHGLSAVRRVLPAPIASRSKSRSKSRSQPRTLSRGFVVSPAPWYTAAEVRLPPRDAVGQLGAWPPPPPLESRMVRYPKRPFMLPALEKTKSKLPALWRNSISRTP